MEVETPYADVWLSAEEWAEAFESAAARRRRHLHRCPPCAFLSGVLRLTERAVLKAYPRTNPRMDRQGGE
jgi:hypothetical protein